MLNIKKAHICNRAITSNRGCIINRKISQSSHHRNFHCPFSKLFQVAKGPQALKNKISSCDHFVNHVFTNETKGPLLGIANTQTFFILVRQQAGQDGIRPANCPHLLTGNRVTSPLIKCVDAIEVERSICWALTLH